MKYFSQKSKKLELWSFTIIQLNAMYTYRYQNIIQQIVEND